MSPPRGSLSKLAAGLGLCALLAAAARPAAAQRPRDRDQPPGAPVQCPYCMGEPDLMQAAGIRSHGGFEFARLDTAGVDAMLPEERILWIESEHFELGAALESIKVTPDERLKVRAECERLAQVLPEVPTAPRVLDPWLRLHLYAQRLEDLWEQFLGLVRVEESDFPSADAVWDGQREFMGFGPYLGQAGKYEVLILGEQASSEHFLRDQFGLITAVTQRYNVIDRDSLILVIHLRQERLRVDEALHGHLAFNLTHILLDGFKHYSYDTPVWLREGLAHWVERGINPRFNTFDFSEGGIAQMTRKADWEPPTAALVRGEKAPSLAQLLAIDDFGRLRLEDHYATWSMVDFLVREHPEFLAELIGGLKGLLDEKLVPSGARLGEAHRALFREGLGMTYSQFDEAWRAWVTANYRSS